MVQSSSCTSTEQARQKLSAYYKHKFHPRQHFHVPLRIFIPDHPKEELTDKPRSLPMNLAMCICPLCNNTHFSMLHKECRANVIERNGFVFPSRRAQHYVVISSKVSESNDTWALGSYLQGMQSLQTDRRGLKQNLFSVMKPVLQFAAQPMDVTSARIWQLKETAWALLNKLPVPKKVTSWFLI